MEEEYKRFLLFAYRSYYPRGGIDDVLDSFDTVEDAKARIAKSKAENEHEYFDLLDLQERKWIDLYV